MKDIEHSIHAALEVLVEPGSVFEIRAPQCVWKGYLQSGYFDNLDKAAREVMALDSKYRGIYLTINPVQPALLARAANRIKSEKGQTTTQDTEIVKRRWLPIDIDARRIDTKIMATEEEHQAAIELARQVRLKLVERGWPEPVAVDSGNGAWLLFRIDLPNDDPARDLVKACLTALAKEFDNNGAEIDTGVFNASRIGKLPGTFVCKGDSTEARPWRRSAILAVPEVMQVVTLEQLAALAGQVPKEQPKSPTRLRQPQEPRDQVKDAQAALEAIGGRADDYEQWVQVGMALSELGNDGLALWESWSAKSSKYQGGECAQKWKGFAPGQGLTVASIFHWADQDQPGWRPARSNGHKPSSNGEKKNDSAGKEHKPDPKDAAILLGQRRGQDWSYLQSQDSYYHWTGTHWQRAGDVRSLELEQIACDVLLELGMSRTKNRIADVMHQFAVEVSRELVSEPGLLNFQNGTLEVEAMDLRPHNRADNLTYCLDYDYAPGDAPGLRDFLNGTIPDQAGRRIYLGHIGLALLGDTFFHKFLLLLGPRRSGKSTLLNLALSMCGHSPNNYAGEVLFSADGEGNKSRAQWGDRRLVALDELPKDAIRQAGEELLKIMSAHGGVPMRQLYKPEAVDNQWRPKLIFATNDRPKYSDRSGALTERLLVIEVPHRRTDSEQDQFLLPSLLKERGQLVNACLYFAKEIVKTGLYPMSQAMRELRSEVERSGDSVKAFVEEECEVNPALWTPSQALYGAYETYCKDELDEQRAVKRRAFTLTLRERYGCTPRKSRDGGIRGIQGIGFRERKEKGLSLPETEALPI